MRKERNHIGGFAPPDKQVRRIDTKKMWLPLFNEQAFGNG